MAEPGRASVPVMAGAPRRILLFGIGARTYGCDIEVVREILPFRRCTRLPGAPPYVCGLINLRGTIATVVDLGLRLGSTAVNHEDASIILVEHGTKVMGLGVDEMRDVQVIPADRIEPAGGASGLGGREELVAGLGHLDGEVVVLLDVRTIVGQLLI